MIYFNMSNLSMYLSHRFLHPFFMEIINRTYLTFRADIVSKEIGTKLRHG